MCWAQPPPPAAAIRPSKSWAFPWLHSGWKAGALNSGLMSSDVKRNTQGGTSGNVEDWTRRGDNFSLQRGK